MENMYKYVNILFKIYILCEMASDCDDINEAALNNFDSDDTLLDPTFHSLNSKKSPKIRLQKVSNEYKDATTSKRARLHSEIRRKTYFSNSADTEPEGSSSTNDQPVTVKEKLFKEKLECKLIFDERYFKIIQSLEESKTCRDKFSVTAQCAICKAQVRGSMYVTSNFIKHLKRHPDEYRKYLELKERKFSLKIPQNSQEALDEKVIDFIVETMSPISVVEKKSFINLISDRGLKVMKRQKAANLISKRYTALMENITSKLSLSNNVCTTADIWSSRTRSFFGYTCHWIDDNFKRHSVALACKRFTGVHNYSRICDVICEIHEKFCLNSHKITATVTDNGANFVKAFREFGVEAPEKFFNDNEKLEEDMDVRDENDVDDEFELPEFHESIFPKILPKHQRCASHTLNLLATTDFLKVLKNKPSLLAAHSNAIQKCSNLWNKINRPKSSEVIHEILGIGLKYPVVTRWNSLFDSISRILSVKNNINRLCTALSVCKFSQQDILYLEEYCDVMRPIAETLDFLQSEKSMYYGYLIPALVTLQTKLRKVHSSDNIKILKETAISLEKNLIERFQQYFSLSPEVDQAIVASVLCPEVKMKCFKPLRKNVNMERQDIHSIVSNYASTFYKNHIVQSAPCLEQQNNITFFDYGDLEDSPDCTDSSNSTDAFTQEFYMYLSDPNTNIEMLNKYPSIRKLFFHVNTTLTSSAPVERLFSFAGLINSSRRRMLSDSNFEKLVLMKANEHMKSDLA